MTCWDVLGIAQTRDRGDIRRAYASRLKETNPEDDAEGFKVLRGAYEQALAFADRGTPPPSAPPKPVPNTTQAPLPAKAPPADTHDDALDAQAADYGALTAALNRLQNSLRPGGETEALESAFESLIHLPAMAAIDVRNDTEERIAWILSRNIPRSDPVIEWAITHFRWDSRDTQRRLPRGAGPLLQRQKDINQLQALAGDHHPHHKAFKILSAPPQPITVRSRLLSPAKPEAVAAFLSDVLRPHPSLRNDLNADTIAAWQNFLARPHLATLGLWNLILSVPALIVGALFATIAPPDYRSLGILAVIPPAFGLAALVYTFGIDLPRRRWRTHRDLASPWQNWGWIGSMAALLIATALPVSSWWLTGIVAIQGCATIMWLVITSEPDFQRGRFRWLVDQALNELNLSLWTVTNAWSLELPTQVRLIIMLVVALTVSAYGRIPLHRAWASAPPNKRRATAFAVAAIAIITMIALWPIGTDTALYPAIIAIVVAIDLLHRCIYMPSAIEVRRAHLFIIVPAGLFTAAAVTGGGILVGSSAILFWIAYVTFRTGLVQRSPAK